MRIEGGCEEEAGMGVDGGGDILGVRRWSRSQKIVLRGKIEFE